MEGAGLRLRDDLLYSGGCRVEIEASLEGAGLRFRNCVWVQDFGYGTTCNVSILEFLQGVGFQFRDYLRV